MLVRQRRLGVPQDSRDSFRLLVQTGLLTPPLALTLERMVGFRNIAVHRYRELDPAIVARVIGEHLGDLLRFAELLRPLLGG